jgi:phosphonopyruvate decarboxylase
MGCTSAIALGAALQQPTKRFIVLDGDGSILMQMGSLATIGHYHPRNLYHIVFDNEGHESTGGQPTVSASVSFIKIAEACGYSTVIQISTKEELMDVLSKIFDSEGPYLLVIKTKQGSRSDLGRPTTSPLQNKFTFVKHLRE